MNNNSKFTAKTTNVLFLFLSAVLVAGMIAISFQSFIDTEASGDKRDHHDKHKYSNSNHHDKHKYSNSKYLPYNKNIIVCNQNNLNPNVNGSSGLNLNAIPKSLESLAAQASDEERSHTGDTDSDSNTFGNGRGGFHDDDNKKNFVFICLNINNQQIINPPTPPLTGVLDLVTANYLSDDVSILLDTGGGTFPPPTNFPSESGPYSVGVGDLDNDGNLDLATAVWNSNGVSILLGKGDGTFGNATLYELGGEAAGVGYVTVGDFDNDGNLDLATANELSHNVSILLGNGDGTFTEATESPVTVGEGPKSIAVGDFDGNNVLDLAVTNYDANTVSILLGNGDGTFTPANPPEVEVGDLPISVAVGDFDGNNILDLAVTNFDSNTVSILLGNGDGTFDPTNPTQLMIGELLINVPVGVFPTSISVGDFDSDENLDLAVANGGSDDVSILLGDGEGTFGPPTNFPVGSAPRSISVGDLNDDGNLDLATANLDANTVSILLGHGDGTFTPANGSPVPVGTEPRFIAVGDFNR